MKLVIFYHVTALGERQLKAQSWEEAAAEMDDWANSGRHFVIRREFVSNDSAFERRIYDTNWQQYGPRGWVK